MRGRLAVQLFLVISLSLVYTDITIMKQQIACKPINNTPV